MRYKKSRKILILLSAFKVFKVLDEHGNNISLQDISRGATVRIVFSGLVLESHPAQIDGALSVQLVPDKQPSVKIAFDAIVIENCTYRL